MAHANEDMLRKAYADFSRGDLQGYLSVCTEDFLFHTPGSNRVAGDYRGPDGLLTLVGKVMELTGGQFQESVEDILANDRHAAVLVVHRFSRDGEPKEYQATHLYRISNGKLAECWEQPRDLHQFDQAWS